MEHSTPYDIDIDSMEEQQLGAYTQKVAALGEKTRNIMFVSATPDLIERGFADINLSRDQKDNLTRIIRDICLGDLYIGNIVLETQKRLSVQPPQAQLIAANVVSHLLMPALEDIKKMESERFTTSTQTSTSPSPSSGPTTPLTAAPPTPPAPVASKPVAHTTFAPAQEYELDDEYVPPVIDLRNKNRDQSQENKTEEI